MSPMEGSPRIAQRRAQFALNRVQVVPAGIRKEYARLVRRLPVMVLRNGLGQAIAFHVAQAKDQLDSAPGQIVRDLSEWLIRERDIYKGDPGSLKALITAITDSDSIAYRRAQAEVLALLDWMKKFADAFLPSEGAAAKGFTA